MADDAPIIFGKYQLLSQIARGGMAEVWKAKAHGVEGFEKILVIKRILPQFSDNPRFVEMFINEAKIAVTLAHANIVQVFDLGHAQDSYFIAMEFVAGMDLASVLKIARRSGRHMTTDVAVYIIGELAKGLDYAHRRRDANNRELNIVHRDVSPQNILLSFEGEVKLTDFGIAKARTLAQTVTELGVVKGKYAYMSPEQLTGGTVDARADIFATGTLLYETLTGKNPFQADSNYDTLKRLRTGDITPIEERAPDIPEEVVNVVHRAMAFAPDERYQSAGELYEDLLQYLYTLGHRVGPRDLMAHLKLLKGHAGDETPAATGEGLRKIFESDHPPLSVVEPGNPDTRPDLLPDSEQSPPDKTRVGRRVPREWRTGTGSGVSPINRERTEWRDVTAMVVATSDEDDLKSETIATMVERFGGTVLDDPGLDVEAGRIVWAMFGDKNPDGRDSDNAARCGLRVSRAGSAAAAALGKATTVAVGMQSGRMLVDLGGSMIADEQYMELLREAHTLSGQAAASQIFVNAEAEHDLRGRFRFVKAGADGSRFILASERSVADAYGRFIGRREALKEIGDSLSLANRKHLRVVALCGEAGSGKSRLLIETMRRLSLAGHTAGLHIAALTPQMKDAPHSAIQAMLRVVLGVDEFDPEALLRDRTTRLRELGLLSFEQAAVEAALGLKTDGRRHSSSRPLRAALLRIIRKLAEDRLTIFAWDGAEYMDDQSANIVNDMLRTIQEARVALILSHRPGFQPRWSDLPNYDSIQLPPLDDEEIARLTAARLGADEIPFELLREVATKSSGNPLYVEEYLKALEEAGTLSFAEEQVIYSPAESDVQVPKTLRGIVASRISRLGPDARYILQVASLAGERFHIEVTAAAAGERVSTVSDALARPEMQGIVVTHGQEFAFAHGLVQQVMMESITLSARREIHAALARAITTLHPDLTNELSERLARHYEEAGDHGRAVQFLIRSADRFERESALDTAVTLLKRAIAILTGLPNHDHDQAFKLYDRIGVLTFRGRDLLRGAEIMHAAARHAEAAQLPSWTARFCMWRGRLLVAASRIEEGRQWLDQAQKIVAELDDRDLFQEVLIATADADARGGEFGSAVERLKRAHELAVESGDARAEIRCLQPLALVHARSGNHERAMASHTAAMKLAREPADALTLCQLHRLESQIQYHARDQKASAEAAARATEVAREAGLHYEAALNAHSMGEAYLRLADHRRAFAALRSSYEVAADRGYTRLQMSNMRVLGYIDATRFQSDEGRARVQAAGQYAADHDFVWDLMQAKFMLAIIDQARGSTDDARSMLREVQTLAAQHGHRNYIEDAEAALTALDAGEQLQLPH